MGGTVVERKIMMAKITGSSPDIFYFSGESLILICIKFILNDTNLNNSFKIHHFKKKKKHFHHCTLGDLNRLPQQLEPQQHKFSHIYAKPFYWLEGAARMFFMKI
jgi:hypothetical protein